MKHGNTIRKNLCRASRSMTWPPHLQFPSYATGQEPILTVGSWSGTEPPEPNCIHGSLKVWTPSRTCV